MLVLIVVKWGTDRWRLEGTIRVSQAPELAPDLIFDAAFSADDLEEELEVDFCLLDYLWRSENVFAQVLINHEFNFSAKQGSHAHLIV